MARTRPRPRPTQAQTLRPVATHCPECGHFLWAAYPSRRTVTTLDAVKRRGRKLACTAELLQVAQIGAVSVERIAA